MLHAEDVMRKDFVKIGMNRPIAHAIELMKEKNAEILVVVEGSGNQSNRYKGLVGKRQISQAGDSSKMLEIMRSDTITVSPDAQLTEVLALRNEKNLRYIPVVSDGSIVGIISAPSVLNVLTEIIPESEGA
jgi:CBS domain-containing protein